MNKKLIIFDLDGVLAESKQNISNKTGREVRELLYKYYVAIISGCSWSQMKNQCMDKLNVPEDFVDLIFYLPTSGSRMYDGCGNLLIANDLKLKDKCLIVNVFYAILSNHQDILRETKDAYGDIEEDRGSQVTFSLKGQLAPLEIKQEFKDKHDKQRKEIARELQYRLDCSNNETFRVGIGGTTSIDVTYINMDKAHGAQIVLNHLGLKRKDALFFGDMLQKGGNDYPIKKMGIDCVEVDGVEDTLIKLRRELKK